MGYCVEQMNDFFVIKKENISSALNALQKRAKQTAFDWVDSREVLNAPSFEDAMSECRWDIYYDSNGDVYGIAFNGEKLGSDFDIFETIAPYVEDGSFISMIGEDRYMFRWYFNNGKLIEEEGFITWK